MPEIVLYVNGKAVYTRPITANDLVSVGKPELGKEYYYYKSNTMSSLLKGVLKSYGSINSSFQRNPPDTNSNPTYNMAHSSSSEVINVNYVLTELPEMYKYNLVLNFEGESVYENTVSKDELVMETNPNPNTKYYFSINPDNTGPFIVGELIKIIVEEKKTEQVKHKSWISSMPGFLHKKNNKDSNTDNAKVNPQQIKMYIMSPSYRNINTDSLYVTELYKLKPPLGIIPNTNTVGGKKKRKTRRNRK